MLLNEIKVGEICLIDWNNELAQLVMKNETRCIVRSLKTTGDMLAEREVSTGTEIRPYEGRFSASKCACGCGRFVKGERKSKIYATSACKVRVYKKK